MPGVFGLSVGKFEATPCARANGSLSRWRGRSADIHQAVLTAFGLDADAIQHVLDLLAA
jgi:hypothetical protein